MSAIRWLSWAAATPILHGGCAIGFPSMSCGLNTSKNLLKGPAKEASTKMASSSFLLGGWWQTSGEHLHGFLTTAAFSADSAKKGIQLVTQTPSASAHGWTSSYNNQKPLRNSTHSWSRSDTSCLLRMANKAAIGNFNSFLTVIS